MLGAAASVAEHLPVPPVGSREGHVQYEDGTVMDVATPPDLQE